jgi:DNA-binding MarR family transcriptional regulator
MVDRLVAAGLLQRRHSPSDGRSVYIGLTEKGSALLEPLASQHARELLQNEPILADALDQLRRMGHPRDSRAQD